MVAVEWLPRENPLIPSAIAAFDSVAADLIRRLLKCPEKQLQSMRGVSSSGVVVITAEHADLPWVDGAIYLGQEANSGIFLPTSLVPSVPAVLLERAICLKYRDLARPFAIIAAPPAVVPMGNAMQITSQALARWLETS